MILHNNLILNQKLQLSQSQIQSLEILAMGRIELGEYLQNEYLENPLLDYIGDNDSFSNVENMSIANESRFSEERPSHSYDDLDINRVKLTYENHDLFKSFILDQLQCDAYSKSQWSLMEFMIECLDDSGFFTIPLEELVSIVGADLQTIQSCLSDLQQLEPYGVFSCDLKHCLLKQLEIAGMKDSDLWLIVDNYLEEVAAGKISTISRSLRLSTSQVRKCIEQIARLNPRPLSGFGISKPQYIVPDIIFHKNDYDWEIELNDQWTQNYRINDYYLSMIQNINDNELSNYFVQKLKRIHFINQSIEQRRQTILSISNEILNKQKLFFEGKSHLFPMTMAEIAEKTNLHPSTISRAINCKYLQYPAGSTLLKTLFSAAVSKIEYTDSLSPYQVKAILKDIISNEDKACPYSDHELVQLLSIRSIPISRRTIAKYRTELGIKTSFDRRIF